MDKSINKQIAESRFIEGRRCDIKLHKTHNSFPLHYHDSFEIDLVLSGEAITAINGIPHRIQKGSIMLLTPVDFHDIEVLTEEPLVTYNIVFDFSIIYSRVWTKVKVDNKVTNFAEDDFISVKSVIDLLIKDFSANDEIFVKTGLEWILFCISKNAPAESEGHIKAEKLVPALAYMYNNFTSNLTLSEVAKVTYLSPMYFSKYFHKAMGMTFQEFLKNMRLDFAMGLLCTTDLSVSQIASQSGFSSVTHFTQTFKKKHSQTPGAFRNSKIQSKKR